MDSLILRINVALGLMVIAMLIVGAAYLSKEGKDEPTNLPKKELERADAGGRNLRCDNLRCPLDPRRLRERDAGMPHGRILRR